MNGLQTKKSLWINGASGRMGCKIQEISQISDIFSFVGGSSLENPNCTKYRDADLLLDFTSETGNQAFFERLKQEPEITAGLIIGSTGLSKNQKENWIALSKSKKFRLLIAPNTSLGVLLTVKAAMSTAKVAFGHDFDIEIVETHHRRKIDQPSGTARFLGESIASGISDLKIQENRTGIREKNELGMHAIRGGGIYGEHEIRMISDDEEICISHKALSRDLFAKGALVLGNWLLNKPVGNYKLIDIEPAELLN